MTKDKWWSLTLLVSLSAWLAFPGLRMIFGFVLAAHLVVLVWGIVDIRLGFFCRVLYKRNDRRDAIALTFDDGPDPSLTPDILRLLAKYDLKATFFVVAAKARSSPQIVRAAFSQGHAIGCHDLSHTYHENFRLGGAMKREIGEAQRQIGQLLGVAPLCYRPPVGLTNPHLAGALKRCSMRCIGWSASAHDAGNRRERAFDKIDTLAKGGAVVLLHDTLPRPQYKEPLLSHLESLFKTIRERRLRAERIDSFFEIPAYRDRL